MSLLTVFTSPKPFTHSAHIDMIQRNTVQALTHLGPEVEVLMIGDEEGMAQVARDYGVRHITGVAVNSYGTPLISSIFELARQNSNSPLLACINADNLLMPDFVEAARRTYEQARDFVIIGQRWDIGILQPLDFSPGWDERLRSDILQRGHQHEPECSDYFVFPRQAYSDIHPFALGRSGWDNWMIYWARQQKWRLVDVTASVMVGHQRHDYSHLPNNKPPYRLPESKENVRLAGGRRAIFSVLDANYRLVDGKVVPSPRTWKRFWREVEIFPLLRLHSFLLANIFYAILRPRRAFKEWRPYLSRVKRTLLGQKQAVEDNS